MKIPNESAPKSKFFNLGKIGEKKSKNENIPNKISDGSKLSLSSDQSLKQGEMESKKVNVLCDYDYEARKKMFRITKSNY
jgi:hypothetical protein